MCPTGYSIPTDSTDQKCVLDETETTEETTESTDNETGNETEGGEGTEGNTEGENENNEGEDTSAESGTGSESSEGGDDEELSCTKGVSHFFDETRVITPCVLDDIGKPQDDACLWPY